MPTSPRVFVTPHAEQRLREHFGAAATPETLGAALAAPVFRMTDGDKTLWGCVSPGGLPFVVASDPVPDGADLSYVLVKTVGPWWYWREVRNQWKAAGHLKRDAGGKRQWRWRQGT